MPRTPKPWFWKERQAWYVTIAGTRHRLGEDRQIAHQRFHELMARPAPVKVKAGTNTVVALLDMFLE